MGVAHYKDHQSLVVWVALQTRTCFNLACKVDFERHSSISQLTVTISRIGKWNFKFEFSKSHI